MTDSERIVAAARAGEWWDGETVVTSALNWFDRWAHLARNVRGGQWEALLRQGEGSESYASWQETIRQFIKEAAARDKAKAGWGQFELQTALLDGLERAAEPHRRSACGRAFEQLVRSLPTPSRTQLADFNRVRQARIFLAALVTLRRVAGTQEQLQ